MKITFITSGSVLSNFTYRALQLSRSLQKRGHEVSIMAPVADKYNNFKSEKVTDIDGVKIIQPFQFKTKRLEINLIPYILHAAYIMIRNKSDLIYIYKPTPISIVGLLGKLLYKTETILDMDDLGSEVMKIEGRPAYQLKLVKWCEDISAKYCDKIVTASTYLKNYFEKIFPEKPILVMSNGVNDEWFEPLVFSNFKKRIVFFGALNRKNILEPLFDVLPNVIKYHPDINILIIGDGKFLEYFKDKVLSLSLGSHVEFTGWLDVSKAKERLKAGDIGYNYMPNEITTRAASNMKVPQYMSRGVVPLVSNVGDLASYVDFGRAGYICEPNNLKALENKIILALSDIDRIKKSGNANLFSLNNFNLDVLSKRFEDWIKNKSEINYKKHDNVTLRNKLVYFVTISTPGNVGGGEIRNFYLLKQWTKLINTDVELFYISQRDAGEDEKKLKSEVNLTIHGIKNKPRTFFRTIRSIFWDHLPPFMNDFKASGIGDNFRKACENNLPDVVHLEQIHAYYTIREHIPWLKSKGVRIILDCHNVEFKSFNESLDIFSFWKKNVGKLLVPTYKKLEIEGVSLSDTILCCSDLDAEFFIKYNKNVNVIPNGVDTAKFEQTRKVFDLKIIFMGGIGYPPNEDAIKFYLSKVHPIVKKHISNVKFLAIGTEQKWLEDYGLSDDSVYGFGFVEDVRPYLREASVGVCPIRYGSGTRLKILTYMASYLPVVSTHKGAEGVNYINNRDIMIEDDPEAFAMAIIKLLKNNSLAEKMGKNGHDFVLKNYDWNIIGEKLIKIYSK